LLARGLPEPAVKDFVAGISGAVQHAYVLQPALATGGQRAAWHREFQARADALLAVLKMPGGPGPAAEKGSEDVEAIDELVRGIGGVSLQDALRLVIRSSKRTELNIKRFHREPGPRQLLANLLAVQWRTSFGRFATSSISDSADGAVSTSPFVSALQEIVLIVEKSEKASGEKQEKKPTWEALRGLAERAVKYSRAQHKLGAKIDT